MAGSASVAPGSSMRLHPRSVAMSGLHPTTRHSSSDPAGDRAAVLAALRAPEFTDLESTPIYLSIHIRITPRSTVSGLTLILPCERVVAPSVLLPEGEHLSNAVCSRKPGWRVSRWVWDQSYSLVTLWKLRIIPFGVQPVRYSVAALCWLDRGPVETNPALRRDRPRISIGSKRP